MKTHTLMVAHLGILLLCATSASALELYVAPDGAADGAGNRGEPLSFSAAIDRASSVLKKDGVPRNGFTINVLGGDYAFVEPVVLGREFRGTEERPIVIRAFEGEEVLFDGAAQVDPGELSPVTDPEERARLSASAVDKVLAATITNPALVAKFNERLMLNLAWDGKNYLPSVFPNSGYAKLKPETAVPEVSPPAVPVGKEDYGIRAANPPYQEPGKPQGWRGTLDDPRGAHAWIGHRADEMAGTWAQWDAEINRNNRRNALTGFIEANWLLSSQPVVSADTAQETIHLSKALSYGWAWRKKDLQFKMFGLLCELDHPGEWHFDPLTNRLYVYPPERVDAETVISLPVASGFMVLEGTTHVSVIGLSVRNVGSGSAYRIAGSHNLVAGCSIRSCTATGASIGGTHNTLRGCDLVDLNTHVSLGGGRRSPTEITPGRNLVTNCHMYQKNFTHEKVNIVLEGVGNGFNRNLVHNSIGQALVIGGNDHLIKLNEFFNVGYEEGDGGAMYSGADLTGYGITYRHNFFHHLMHVPGKVERSGIHLDDQQAGSICEGNLFYKSAAKGIFMNGGAGHVLRDNIFLEGNMGVYNVGAGAQKGFERQEAILADPNHMYRNTKENYVGRAEKIVGKSGWAKEPWRSRYPLFNQVMSDTGQFGRMWPIRCRVENSFYYKNTRFNRTEWSRVAPEAMEKVVIQDDREISPDVFVDYEKLDLRFKEDAAGLPDIPFEEIGLRLDEYRTRMPDKQHYRTTIKNFYQGIGSMPGTTKQIDTAKVVEEGPVVSGRR